MTKGTFSSVHKQLL